MAKSLHERLYLFIDNDSYTFVPSGESAATQSLSIDRTSGTISLNALGTSPPSTARRSPKSVYGIMGIISLSMSEYVVLITGRDLRGRLAGHDIYKATSFDILPLNPNISADTPPHPVEGHLIALLNSHLTSGSFLLSYTFDLSRRLQAQWATRAEDENRALWQTADDRFFWNKFIQTRLIEAGEKQDLDAYIVPILFGTFDVRPAFVQGRHMHIALISRRSRYRAGTRYFRRGIDSEGHVANFNETEQIILVEAPNSSIARNGDEFVSKLSFVQIRGSIPLYWAEINTMRYKPDLQIMDKPDTNDAMKLHLLEQVSEYGGQVLVNLVNHKGHEKPVKDAYERITSELNIPNVRYNYFDFHTECKSMRWDRISILIDVVKDELDQFGYFHLQDGEAVKTQTGTIRTNCMDNLDRTNVGQGAIAKHVLEKQLQELGVFSPNGTVDEYPQLSKDLRELWADHGDAIAMAYAGSGALKSDFTRTNKRTKMGALEDGVKSAVRYLKNNYFDGARQDAYDLFTGAWVPRRGPSASSFLVTDSRPLITRAMPVIAFFSLFMICAGLTLPRTSEYSLLYYFALWWAIFAAALGYMTNNGIDFVSWPKLLPPTDIIYYTGPGFRSARHGMGVSGAKDVSAAMAKTTKWLNGGKRRTLSRMETGDISISEKKHID